MARRALRRIDPSLDLSDYLTTVDELPSPWDAERLFGRSAPLEVEVGSGKGLFLRTAAEASPEVDFLGIEVARKYARFAAAALAKRGLRNAIVVLGDALQVFDRLLPDQSLAAVHRPGGTFHFWTDVKEYFDASLELLAQHPRLAGPFQVSETPAEHDMAYRTHFERRMRLNDQPVYRAEYRKSD